MQNDEASKTVATLNASCTVVELAECLTFTNCSKDDECCANPLDDVESEVELKHCGESSIDIYFVAVGVKERGISTWNRLIVELIIADHVALVL